MLTKLKRKTAAYENHITIPHTTQLATDAICTDLIRLY